MAGLREYEIVARVMMSETRSVRAWRASAVNLFGLLCELLFCFCVGILRAGILRLRVEDVSSCTLGHGHTQVHIQSNSCDLNTWIVPVRTGQECGIVVVVMSMAMAMAMRMCSHLL